MRAVSVHVAEEGMRKRALVEDAPSVLSAEEKGSAGPHVAA